MIIIDFGSGNSCHNDWEYVKKMITGIASIDTHLNGDVIFKWQLFEKSGNNIPLQRSLFAKARELAWGFGYETTASVFDVVSLDFLLKFEVPFIKIANHKKSYEMLSMIPDGIRIIKSVGDSESFGEDCMACVSKYPAKKLEYEKIFKEEQLKKGISDHTTNWDLYNKYQPELFEKHFVLKHDLKNNLDGGLFSATPEQWKEIL